MSANCPTQAVILAAGSGTRLRPITNDIPKCMVEVGGRPLLEHTVRWLASFGVSDLVINLHHRGNVISDYFADGGKWGVRITYSHEPEVQGTAGALRNLSGLLDGPFLVWYGDNLSKCSIDRLWESHRASSALVTIAVHYRDDPTSSGIVALDDDDRILRFREKPARGDVFSHWVSAGIMAVEQRVLDAIPRDGKPDWGRDVLPSMLATGETLHAYRLSSNENLMWIDTAEDLDRVRAAWVGA